jgi:hypothetical protein
MGVYDENHTNELQTDKRKRERRLLNAAIMRAVQRERMK